MRNRARILSQKLTVQHPSRRKQSRAKCSLIQVSLRSLVSCFHLMPTTSMGMEPPRMANSDDLLRGCSVRYRTEPRCKKREIQRDLFLRLVKAWPCSLRTVSIHNGQGAPLFHK